jgi:hypothetical protein
MSFPTGDSAPVVRTDFLQDDAWNSLIATMRAPVDPFVFNLLLVDDRENDGVTPEELMQRLPEGFSHGFILLADEIALSQEDQPLLVVDLLDEPGRWFRVAARHAAAVENNLSLGNMKFAELAQMVDETGVLRGLPEI